jgi:hypothetical protein
MIVFKNLRMIVATIACSSPPRALRFELRNRRLKLHILPLNYTLAMVLSRLELSRLELESYSYSRFELE